MELAVTLRKEKARELKQLRKQNIVPWVIYGKYIDAPMNISCDKQDFLRIYRSAGYSMPITLEGDGIDQLVLIHDIQVDPVTDYVMHVDFITLKKWQKVQTEVQIVVDGVAPVEKLWLWNIQLVKDTVEIEALPKDLPHDIKIDISGIENTNDVIFVKDLDLGKGVELIDDPEQAIITVSAIVEEVEEETEESNDSEAEAPGEAPTTEEKTEENKE